MTTEKVVLVFKASNGDTGLLWFPKSCRQKHYPTGLAIYQLGQWFLYDILSDRIVRPLEGAPPYETRFCRETPERDVVVEVNVPICFFGDRIFNQFVAYAPGFGRVASFLPQTNLRMDCLYHAWIAFFGLYRNADFTKVLNTLNVQWVLTSLTGTFTVGEMQSAANLGLIENLVNGIVISYGDFDVSDDPDNLDDRLTNDVEDQEEHRKFKIVMFWTPWLHSICTFRHEESNENADLNPRFDFRVGTWFSFMPAADWSKQGVAISPFRVRTPEGMALIGRDPLKLRIAHNLYNLDQDPAARFLHVPGWLGVIQCNRKFLNSLRNERQTHSLLAPRLTVELGQSQNWLPVDFDGRKSPIRETPAKEVTDDDSRVVDEEGVEVRESDVGDQETEERAPPLSTSGGFSHSLRSASMNMFSTPTSKNKNDFGDTLHVEKQENKRDGGFGRSRHNNFMPVNPPLSFTGNMNSSKKTSDESKENNLAPPQTITTTRESFGESKSGARNRPRTSPAPSSRTQNIGGIGRRSSPISSQQDKTFLQKCNHRPGGIEKKNLSGVVVAKSSSNNRDRKFIIYSPEFSDGEISVPASTCGNLSIGSWVKFSARVNDGKINPTDFEVEQVSPFETVAIGNTVKIKLNAYVPRRWFPRMSTFEPIVKTDFVAKVVDSKGLFDETCADQQLTVWIARSVSGPRYNIPWHVDRIED